MPLKDARTKATATKGKLKSAGHMRVVYVDAKGRTREAKVLGPGTASGLKLQIMSGAKRSIIDNVPKATAVNSTQAYITRIN